MEDKSNNSTLGSVRILSLFDGMACGMLAMQEAGLDVTEYFAYEIDRYAIKTATHNFPQIQELGNVFKADFTKYNNIDYLIGGSPCFTKGQYVLTDKGYKDISEIEVGDMVLTHKGRYRKVVHTNKREANIVDVKITGYPTFHTTSEHPFYTLEKRKATSSEYAKFKTWRIFSDEPIWTKAVELKPNVHFCGQHIPTSAFQNIYGVDSELAYILGRYVADGHIRKRKRLGRKNSYQYQVCLSIGAEKIEQFKKNVTQRHYSCYKHTENVYRVCFSSMELLNFIEQQGFGKGAYNKAIPEFIFDLPKELQFMFLRGYADGDGCVTETQYSASTVSPKLAFGLQRLITQLYNVNVGVAVHDNNKPHKIKDRQIHSNYPLYTVLWKKEMKKQSVAHIQNGIVWTQVKNVYKTSKTDTVYNIEVDEDNSYTINNVIVHNCTYWSIAQSPDKRETTASGMGWELFSQYVRALHEVNPKYFIYENNKSMARGIYDSISETFGFEPVCINSALLSAQNRQRLYWVGKRNADGTYSKVDVEQPEDKGILLKDVLDGVTDREKGRAVIGSIGRTTEREYFKKFQGNMSFEPVGTTKDGKSYCLGAGYSNGSGKNIGNYAAHTLQKGCKSMVAEPVNITTDGKAQCLRATCYKDTVRNIVGNDIDKKTGVAEQVCMRYERSEKAKQLRKDYESGAIKHGYHEYHELQPRTDGKTNTVSTVLKDNPICEPVCIASRCRYLDENTTYQHYEPRTDGKTNAITTVQKDNLVGEPVKVCSIDSHQGNRIYSVDGKAVSQVANGGGLGGQTGLYAQPVTSSVQVGALPRPIRIYDTNAKSVTLKAGGAGGKTGLYAIPVEFEGDIPTKAVSCSDGKTYTVYEVKNGQIVIKGKIYPIKLVDGYYIIRKLTVSECKRLQTVPEWYEFPVSDTQAYKMLGNGWTVDVIAHLINATR